ncbi:hypothetical protein HMI56_003424, partial [Coelomomyces lativittatus]
MYSISFFLCICIILLRLSEGRGGRSFWSRHRRPYVASVKVTGRTTLFLNSLQTDGLKGNQVLEMDTPRLCFSIQTSGNHPTGYQCYIHADILKQAVENKNLLFLNEPVEKSIFFGFCENEMCHGNLCSYLTFSDLVDLKNWNDVVINFRIDCELCKSGNGIAFTSLNKNITLRVPT